MGPRGDAAEPAGLFGESLDEATGAGLDPCVAVSCIVEPAPEEEAVVVFLLGCAGSEDEAAGMKNRFSPPENAEQELERVKAFWSGKLEAIRIQTPDDSFDMMMNGWLLYQTTACRLWARTGYYQAGGAYGFRDQLQDCMALLNSWPELSRSRYCCMHPGSSGKAMSSTGGMQKEETVYGPGIRTTSCGWLSSLPNT